MHRREQDVSHWYKRLLLTGAPVIGLGAFGGAARTQVEHLTPSGVALRIEYDIEKQGRYGRELAYPYLYDDRSVNELLLRQFAVVSVYRRM